MDNYKVLLIDDEHLITEGLKVLIDWSLYNCEIIGTADNGIDGLDLIKKTKPDIVFTDIQMPNMTGLDMIKEAQSICNCFFIILSGYSDFNYAKQCLSLDVKDYLLKPIEETQLIKTLNEVINRINEVHAHSQHIKYLEENNQYLNNLSKDFILHDFLRMDFDNTEECIGFLNHYNIQFPKSTSFLCFIFQSLDDVKSFQLHRKHYHMLLNDYFKEFLLFSYDSSSFMCILGINAFLTLQKISTNLLSFVKDIQNEFNITVTIGIGKPFTNLKKINISINQALFALSFQIITGLGSVNYFEHQLKNVHYISVIPDTMMEDYKSSFSTMDYNSISKNLDIIFDYITCSLNLPIVGVEINTFNFILICIQQLSNLDNNSTLLNYKDLNCFEKISKIKNIGLLKKYVKDVIYDLLDLVNKNSFKNNATIIDKIRLYVNEHIYEDTSLLTVANEFYLSPVYLSKFFKKETGVLYLDYIVQVKLDTAKTLLTTSDLMIYEISEKLGYKDSKYFSKLFEKKTGYKPSTYRKLYG